jgi:hypothetical protein
VKLRQIATIRAGYPFRGKIPEVASTRIAAVQMKDISLNKGIQWQNCVTTVLTGKREPAWLQAGDILLAARGNHHYAIQVDDNMAGFQVVAAPHFFVISLKCENVLPSYLVWLLNQSPCQRYFEQNAEGSITKSIRRNILEETPIVVPPLAKQQMIIKLIDILKQEQRIVEQLLQNGERLMSGIASDLFNDGKEVNDQAASTRL